MDAMKRGIGSSIILLLFTAMMAAQTEWEKYSENPVLRGSQSYGILGDFDQNEALHPFIIEENGYYRMWYVGARNNYSVGAAISTDAIHWYVLRGNPLLAPGPPGSFDAAGIKKICVVHDKREYKMYYYTTAGGVNKIGLATSPDGYTWTKYGGNPVLDAGPSGTWDGAGVWAPTVVVQNKSYKMWYQGYDGAIPEIGYASIGHATSSDGIHWTKYPGNPVLQHGGPGDFDYYTSGEPFVLQALGRYHLFYTSTSGSIQNKIGYAVSRDGISWTKSRNNPVLTAGPSSWDGQGVAAVSVIATNRELKMFYVGWGGPRAIGLATADWDVAIEADPSQEGLLETGLLHAYPNPFNPSTTIRFVVPSEGLVKIVVYDLLGREVATLVNEFKARGDYSITWNPENGASGTYFCRLIVGASTEVRKLLLMK